MDRVTTNSTPDHTSLSPTIPTTTSGLNQANIGAGSNNPCREKPKIDASTYTLVFGMDDTGSETSLTGVDSPLIYDSTGRLLPNSAQSQHSGSDGTHLRPTSPRSHSDSNPSDAILRPPSDVSTHPPSDSNPSDAIFTDAESHTPSDTVFDSTSLEVFPSQNTVNSAMPIISTSSAMCSTALATDATPHPASDGVSHSSSYASTHPPLDSDLSGANLRSSKDTPHPSTTDTPHPPSDVTAPEASLASTTPCSPSVYATPNPSLHAGLCPPSDATPHPSLNSNPPDVRDVTPNPPSNSRASSSHVITARESASTAKPGPDTSLDKGEGPKGTLSSTGAEGSRSSELLAAVSDVQSASKTHPLSILTSDSEVGETPTPPPEREYSPIPNTSGDEEDTRQPPLSPTSPLPSSGSPSSTEDIPVMTVLFSGITYLGSSSVDAPISEIEANRKMHVLREQSEGTEPIPVILSVPVTNHGTVVLRDPKTDQPMATYPIKLILFCARGNAEVLLDCFCLNVKNKRSGLYQCHVFRCEVPDSCDRIFKAIGKAFTTKSVDKSLPPLTGDNIRRDFLVSLDIHEEDGKGYFAPVPVDKDCFKLRQNVKKKVTISVSQLQSSERPLVVTRCFGLLVSPGKDVKVTHMDLLDNMNPSPNPGPSFTVSGIWDTNLPALAALNEETKSSRFQYLTVAADLILESVTEPIRFRREVKVHVSKGGMSYTILNQLIKKKQGPMDQLVYTLKLKKSVDSSQQQCMYVLDELRPASELRQAPIPTEVNRLNSEDGQAHTPSPTQKTKRLGSIRARISSKSQDDPDAAAAAATAAEDENEDEDDTVVSGWGDVETPGMREDLLKDWGEILERWDGKDRARPSRVTKLCRKGIPRDLRCQVWQMLTGAAHDPQLAEAYRLLISKESPAENVINWDIKRTYVGHDYFQDPANREALYKISKAYSVYDEEVGYCQGFSFMAAVLLLQKMPEETAFSVLVKIMYSYGHRNLFKANFRDLHLMFYQLDRLLEEIIPDLFQHLQANRIETHMFASQWFLTLYTAKFPLSIVFKILDIYLCERIGVIFQVALSLLKISRKDLMALDFEGILGYFRTSLPKKFQAEEDCQLLFDTMFTFKVNEKKLLKLQKDYQSYLEQQAQLEDPVMRLERDNKVLRDTIHRLEQENDNLAQDLVGSKIKLRTEMDKLEERIDSLSKEARTQKNSYDSAQQTVGELREELKQAKEEFQRVMIKLTEERLQHEAAVVEYKQLFKKLDDGHQKQKEELSQELIEVKAKLGSSVESTNSSVPSSLSSEQRLRNLELELAQTKLALVESQCKNQELEHKIVELSAAKAKKWYDMDFVHKKK